MKMILDFGMAECINLSFKNLSATDIIKLAGDPTVPVCPIRVVKLGYNDLGDEGAAAVATILCENQTITCLDLGFNRIGDAGIKSLAAVLAFNVTLEVLYLSGNLLSSIGFKFLSEGVSRNKKLKALYLTGNNGRENGAKFLAEGLRGNCNITKLYLNGNKIGSAGCSYISKFLQFNSSVRHINLSDNNICDQGIFALSEALDVNRNLTELELSFNTITHVGMLRMCESLNGYTSMKRLLLDNNKLGDKGAKCLAAALVRMQVVELNIGFNGIEAEGLIDIINSIYSNPTIEILTLSGNNITNTVSRVIANMLLHNYKLRQLYLDHTNIGPIGEKYIAAGIATNKRSGMRILTGFQLGKVLTYLNSPPHLSNLSNEAALTYLAVMWEAHQQSLAGNNVPSTESNGLAHQQQWAGHPNESPSSSSAEARRTAASSKAINQQNMHAVDTSSHYHSAPSKFESSSATGEEVLQQSVKMQSSDSTIFFLLGDKSNSSNNNNNNNNNSNEVPISEGKDSDKKAVKTLSATATDFHSFPFLSKLNDQLTGKDNDIDMILSFSERENVLRSDTTHLDLDGMSLKISQTNLSSNTNTNTNTNSSNSGKSDKRGSFEVAIPPRSASAAGGRAGEGASSSTFCGASCLVPVHLKEVTEFAKSLSSKPYNAAELWELHQFYFSPPTEDAASLLSSSQWSSSDEDDEEGAAGDSKRYCHSKNRSYGPHGAAISSNSDSNGHCGPAVMDAKSRKKRATISTMVRIAQYPRVKEYLNAHKADNEEAKLTLLRQLKFLESCGADLHDAMLESLLLDEIFNH